MREEGQEVGKRPQRSEILWTQSEVLIILVAGLGALLASKIMLALFLQTGAITLSPLVTSLLLSCGEALLVVPLWWLLRAHQSGWGVLGFRTLSLGRAFVLLVQALLLTYALIVGFGLLLRFVGARAQENIFPSLLGETPLALVGALLAAAVVAPLAEEAFFRGFLFTALRQRWGAVAGAVVSGIIFATIHLTPNAFPQLLGVGLVLAWLFHRSGSVWPGVALHAFVNTVTLLIWFSEPYLS